MLHLFIREHLNFKILLYIKYMFTPQIIYCEKNLPLSDKILNMYLSYPNIFGIIHQGIGGILGDMITEFPAVAAAKRVEVELKISLD